MNCELLKKVTILFYSERRLELVNNSNVGKVIKGLWQNVWC